MEATRKRLLFIIVSITFGQLLIGATLLVAQSDCKLVLDALSKSLNTPTHLYSTTIIGDTTQTAESIYAGGAIYMKIAGKWSLSPITMQETKQQMQKNQRDNKETCRYLHDELIDGEIAAVYSVHEESPKAKSDSQIWISKAKRLPLRSEWHADTVRNSTRYEYGNVKPPM